MRSSLARHFPKANLDWDELHRMAKAAWHRHGIALIRAEDLPDNFDRQAVINAAERLYGKREEERL